MALQKKLKIAFVCEYDINDPFQRSGVPYFIAKTFKELGHEVIQIGPFQNNRGLLQRIWNAFLVNLFNKFLKAKFGSINNQWSKEFLRNYAVQTECKLHDIQCDVVFSPESHTIAYLNTDKPIVFWRDATFDNILNYYPEFSNLHPKSVREGHRSECEAIERASLMVYTSHWAAENAIKMYGADSNKVKIIERGANLENPPQNVRELIETKINKKLKILFIGANWKRKGGDVAYKTAEYLNQKGLETELHVVGTNPEPSHPWPEWFKYHGYVNKSKPEGFKIVDELFRECHFFMMPSIAENFGIVFAEASAYGVPSIGFETGGVSSAIHHLKNGLLLPNITSEAQIGTTIQSLFQDKTNYKALCISTRQDFEERLNWESNVGKCIDYINNLL